MQRDYLDFVSSSSHPNIELESGNDAAMHLWLVQLRKSSAEGSALSKAIDYSLKRWPAFTRYADSGHLPIDNNPMTAYYSFSKVCRLCAVQRSHRRI